MIHDIYRCNIAYSREPVLNGHLLLSWHQSIPNRCLQLNTGSLYTKIVFYVFLCDAKNNALLFMHRCHANPTLMIALKGNPTARIILKSCVFLTEMVNTLYYSCAPDHLFTFNLLIYSQGLLCTLKAIETLLALLH